MRSYLKKQEQFGRVNDIKFIDLTLFVYPSFYITVSKTNERIYASVKHLKFIILI